MTMRPVRLAALQVLLLIGAVHLQTANAATNIGVASAAQNEVHGNSQPLSAGSHVFQDEVITTGAKSMAQFLFLDETSLSVGPLSNVTLDKFIYNPSTGAGSVVIDVAKGAFRFVSGSQPSSNYKINTAIATIGTRGTIVDGYRSEKGLYLIAQEGKADGAVIVTVNGVEYVLKPGQALFISATQQVTGPMAPDDEFFDVVGVGGPFPLFGGLLPGEHEQFDVPDGGTIRGDDLFQHPQPCDEGDYGALLGPWAPKPLVQPVEDCDSGNPCTTSYFHDNRGERPIVWRAVLPCDDGPPIN